MAPARRTRRQGARNPGVVVHRLLWSMSHGRRVRVTLKAGNGVRTKRVVRWWAEPRRDTKNAGAENSTVVVQLDDGEEVAVNAIERVQLPIGDAGAAFGDD